VYHNLRCALDYIVTALVVASDEEVTNRHQFPIFHSSKRFRANVLDRLALLGLRGLLSWLLIGHWH